MSEAGGQSFGAVWAGKFKMGFQSGTILVILIYVTFLAWRDRHDWERPARLIRDVGNWGTVIITLYSGITYVRRAAALFQTQGEGSL